MFHGSQLYSIAAGSVVFYGFFPFTILLKNIWECLGNFPCPDISVHQWDFGMALEKSSVFPASYKIESFRSVFVFQKLLRSPLNIISLLELGMTGHLSKRFLEPAAHLFFYHGQHSERFQATDCWDAGIKLNSWLDNLWNIVWRIWKCLLSQHICETYGQPIPEEKTFKDSRKTRTSHFYCKNTNLCSYVMCMYSDASIYISPTWTHPDSDGTITEQTDIHQVVHYKLL